MAKFDEVYRRTVVVVFHAERRNAASTMVRVKSLITDVIWISSNGLLCRHNDRYRGVYNPMMSLIVEFKYTK